MDIQVGDLYRYKFDGSVYIVTNVTEMGVYFSRDGSPTSIGLHKENFFSKYERVS